MMASPHASGHDHARAVRDGAGRAESTKRSGGRGQPAAAGGERARTSGRRPRGAAGQRAGGVPGVAVRVLALAVAEVEKDGDVETRAFQVKMGERRRAPAWPGEAGTVAPRGSDPGRTHAAPLCHAGSVAAAGLSPRRVLEPGGAGTAVKP